MVLLLVKVAVVDVVCFVPLSARRGSDIKLSYRRLKLSKRPVAA